MTQQTHGTPELNYSEETFRDMYEALKMIYNLANGYTDIPKDEVSNAIRPILTKADGK